MNAEKAKEIATKAKEIRDKEEYEKFLAEDLPKILKDIETEASKGEFCFILEVYINTLCENHLIELGFTFGRTTALRRVIYWN